ncbi:MAG: bifunctional phosphoribosyl-AMP cyclohydrolase/phosphoribosyl-ATP diphosphatase HisIE [Campylobacter sp.]|nr:bifunctional phosphoribosyl-AMP cyclohydrolase/phosphoribosyl-ATP diphosphatase HisIE [Campylobacter sp.]
MIEWDKSKGLIPTIAQDLESGQVLMLAYSNKESYELSLKSGFAHYFSRSRSKIWMKGESSGNTQKIKEILLDCDNDTLLFKVLQKGAACHTGNKSCFFTPIQKNDKISKISDIPTCETIKSYDILDELYHVILDRKLNSTPEKSHVSRLFTKGENAILKKISEEAGEFILACKDITKFELYSDLNKEKFGEHVEGDPSYDAVYEASDLLFHMLVALAAHNIHPSRILDELAKRNGISGIDEKKSRKP